MASPATCPRGHELAENAVYCTVCWIRVEPVDPEVIAARKRRQRRIWIPLFGAGAVALGVAVGGTLGAGSGIEPGAVVAGEAAPGPVPVDEPPAAEPSIAAAGPDAAGPDAAGAAPETVAAPLAATVAEPAGRTLTTCVPDGTATVLLKGRSDKDQPWAEIPADTSLGGRGDCPEGEVEATVSAVTEADRWRVITLDDAGERVGRATVDAPVG